MVVEIYLRTMGDSAEGIVWEPGMQMDMENSNVLVIHGGKKNRKNEKTQSHATIKIKESKKVSNSRKRKLKKLEEEKEMEQLRAKSLETLEKYKISEGAYSLLWSARKIGQADTRSEKKRRTMEFSKAGLEAPCDDKRGKRKSIDAGSSEEKESEDEERDPSISSYVDMAQKQLALEATIKSCNSSLRGDSKEKLKQYGADVEVPSDCRSEVNQVFNDDNGKPTMGSPGGSSAVCNSSNDKQSHTAEDEVEADQTMLDCSLNNDGCCPSMGALSVPIVVHVSRPKEVEESRRDLPIFMMEQEIMEAINEHISVIICGETGCGKTTQVPQFLYEAGFGSSKSSVRSGIIGVTQPRRIAVLATAKRVAFELNLRLGKEVGFQVRHDKRIGENSKIKFMTDGILLRELQGDFLLKRYSVIILDEAHERSLNTDILIGMLSRVIRQRQEIFEEQQQKILSGEVVKADSLIFPLKLILMSATLRVEDFTSGERIFPVPPPIIKVQTRQFPVTVHFSKKTELVDYLGQAYKKVMAIHRKLPPGGILVFVTGQREVELLCRRLRKASNDLIMKSRKGKVGSEDNMVAGMENVEGCEMKEIDEALDMHPRSTQRQDDRFHCFDDHESDLDADESDALYSSETDESSDDDLGAMQNSEVDSNPDEFLGEGSLSALKAAFAALAGNILPESEHDENQTSKTFEECADESNSSGKEIRLKQDGLSVGPMRVLPLYAMLPAAAQLRVFEKVGKEKRLVVVATNVAETSLTIPGITYVVDTGREKVKNYNSSNGMESYEIQWISKASAAQRAGRAGRTGPGHCYRLYSSAVFNNQFSNFSTAEISKIPVDGVVLLMKSMGISKVANFPFPTPPDATGLVEAERCLKALDALDSEGRLTHLGKAMAQYPMSPRHSRMLLTAVQIMNKENRFVRPNIVLGYAVASAAALSLSNPFVLRFEGIIKDVDNDVHNQNKYGSSTGIEGEKLSKRKLKEAVKATRAKFSNPKSDALTIAYALHCFEISENPSEFCDENSLHLKTMEEMSKLRKQLLHLVFNQELSNEQKEFSWTHGTQANAEDAWKAFSDKNPLTQIEEDVLCLSICAGWADRVAKRIRGTSELSELDKKVNAVRYRACSVKETVFLHRWSSLSKSAPEFLVYSELLHTKRPYIHGATSLESDWLVKYARSLCTFSAPLEDPKPCYEHHADRVVCFVIPHFGPHLWQLPHSKVPIKDNQQRAAAFAFALLDGQVLPCLKSVRCYMAAQPSSILRPEAAGQKRVGNLLSKLKTKSIIIDSCAKLREVWKENDRMLYKEVLDWFQSGFHDRFEELWNNMQQEALQPSDVRFPFKRKRRKTG
ncbi:hypothetical protein Droror1_Dr00006871 [Drosera rotundifolia]